MAESSIACHRSTTHHPPPSSLPPLDRTTNLLAQSPKLDTDLDNRPHAMLHQALQRTSRSSRHQSLAYSTAPSNPPDLAATVLHPL
nr:hypothetical protein CFP56_36095 [Quercus suber]